MLERKDTLERIRRGYRALGLGAHRDVAAMFEVDGDASSALDGDASSALDCHAPSVLDRDGSSGLDGDASSAFDRNASGSHDAEGRDRVHCGAPGGDAPCRREDAEWVVFDLINGRPWATRDLVALDLFGGLPYHWDLVGVDVEHWQCGPWRRFAGFGPAIDGVTSLVVGGHYRARPRAPDHRWHVERVPFLHIWRLVGARVESVYSYLDGIEIRRLPVAA